MRILLISKPNGSLADFLMKSNEISLICVTQDDVYLRDKSGDIISGINIECLQKVKVDIPEIKMQLLKAYPLIDRWVGRQQSISTTIGIMLDYTVTLIQKISNHPPRIAIIETGAPHHLFTYCLDVALNYLQIKIFYLYGNAFDGRCLIFEGNEKKSIVHVSDYSSKVVVEDYINKIKKNALYIPEDSTKSISPFLHKSLSYASYLCIKFLVFRCYQQIFVYQKRIESTQIKLRLPYISFLNSVSIFLAHRKYKKLLLNQSKFDVSKISSTDIVYVGHMLPEATSFPESPNYPDEIDILIDLKTKFPNSKIFYREHPAIEIFSEFGHIHFQGLHKCPAFFHQLIKLGIEVVSPSIHISKIRVQGCLFATKTGRVAIENSILGLPTILYGHPFYGIELPFTFHISKIGEKSTVQNIKSFFSSTSDSEFAIKKYLVDMFSGSIENPGISLSANHKAQNAFENSFLQLIKILEKESNSLNENT